MLRCDEKFMPLAKISVDSAMSISFSSSDSLSFISFGLRSESSSMRSMLSLVFKFYLNSIEWQGMRGLDCMVIPSSSKSFSSLSLISSIW